MSVKKRTSNWQIIQNYTKQYKYNYAGNMTCQSTVHTHDLIQLKHTHTLLCIYYL